MIYFAYGSNQSGEQMAKRCPSAVYLGNAEIRDYRLTFQGYSFGRGGAVASIEQSKGDRVLGCLWEIRDPRDVKHLDACEGWPTVYRCDEMTVWAHPTNPTPGKRRRCRRETAWVYVKQDTRPGYPTSAYVQTIAVGLKENGLPLDGLVAAMGRCPSRENSPRPPARPSATQRVQRAAQGKRRGKKGGTRYRPVQQRQTQIIFVRPCEHPGCVEDVSGCSYCGGTHCEHHCPQVARNTGRSW